MDSQHKPLFSLLLALNVLESEGIITQEQARFLLAPQLRPSQAETAAKPNPSVAAKQQQIGDGDEDASTASTDGDQSDFIRVDTSGGGGSGVVSDAMWQAILALSECDGMQGIDELIASRLAYIPAIQLSAEPFAALGAITHGDASGFVGQHADDDNKKLTTEADMMKRSLKDDLLLRMQPVNSERASPKHPPTSTVQGGHRGSTMLSPTRLAGLTTPTGTSQQQRSDDGEPTATRPMLKRGASFNRSEQVATSTLPGRKESVVSGTQTIPRPPSTVNMQASVVGANMRRGRKFSVASIPTIASADDSSMASGSNSVAAGKWRFANAFQQLLLLKCLRPDALLSAVQSFVSIVLGKRFVEPVTFDINQCYEESVCHQPVIFMLASGADPISDLIRLSDAKGYGRRFKHVSLGQKQGPIAEAIINEAIDNGSWVCLQNCHLAESWLPELERIVTGLNPLRTHPEFRLWLTSMPTEGFPVSVLQCGLKVTNEPPEGIRAKLLTCYSMVNRDWFETSAYPRAFKKLFFGLAMFHAITQERRRFGPLGFNCQYDFNDSDFTVSLAQVWAWVDVFC